MYFFQWWNRKHVVVSALGLWIWGCSAIAAPAPIRGLHVVTKAVPLEKVKHWIDQAAEAQFNTLILGVGWGGSTKLNSMPWVTEDTAWSREQLLEVVNYARGKSLEVIPNLPLLTHQSQFLGNSHPELLYNSETYDPRNPKVYELVLAVLEEVINLLHPSAIHIGHDELYGSAERPKNWKTGEALLPAEWFLRDVHRIHDYLAQRGVETWMWGDMLIAPEEFPEMNRVFLLGGVPGYGATLRRQLPKDIVICDWHYDEKLDGFDLAAPVESLSRLWKREGAPKTPEFRTIEAFRQDGFRVVGATFEKEATTRAFSAYAARHGASGMMATVWFDIWKDPSIVDQIIETSGDAFVGDFPDGP
ncbi:family 20 glycosylhydrolase [Methylococcus geothermalis]|uniref:family 20 glycosylhydrolase n=1 Tax=Methylococcus geothermalis TaxID=2681310 RepID=UPI00146B5A31|nr:family 20 glycosylhydrolase [Methylococcus geothermalis]